jgi:CheY-like chemotaxis protein
MTDESDGEDTSATYDFSHLDILVVDDNDFAHKIMREVLLAMRIKTIRHAQDAVSCRRELDRKIPDVLVVDLNMHPVDGFALIAKLRQDPDERILHLPVLVTTSYSTASFIKRARDCGASEILCKPVSVAAVYDRLVHMRNSPRKFVKTETYVGPDRRRVVRGFEGLERRGAPPPDKATEAKE